MSVIPSRLKSSRSMAPPENSHPKRFEVAFSFAGKHREKVHAIAQIVQNHLGEGKVFFDEWFEHEILGDDMDVLLQRFYHKQSLMVVADISDEYAGKPWCRAEARAIRALRFEIDPARDETGRLRLLNIKFGEGDVPGIFPTTAYLDGSFKSVEECASLILKRHSLLLERSYIVPVAARNASFEKSAPKKQKFLTKSYKKTEWSVLCGSIALALIFAIPMPSKDESSIRVPALNGLTSELPEALDLETGSLRKSKGIFVLPSSSQARFVHASATNWTDDTLQNLEIRLKDAKVKSQCDITRLVTAWVREKTHEKFIEWLVRVHDEELVKVRRIAIEGGGQDREAYKKRMETVINFMLIPLLKKHADKVDPETLTTPMPIIEEISTAVPLRIGGGDYSKELTAFWKRILAMAYQDMNDRKIFGPYYGAGGCDEAAGPHAPDPQSPQGSLIAVLYDMPLKGNRLGAPLKCVPFFQDGHAIENASSKPLLVRFVINDQLPEDNGLGYCDVKLEMDSKVSLATRMIAWGMH